MENNPAILYGIFIACSIGILIYGHYLPKIKGSKGERRIARLLRNLNKKEYKVFHDIHLKLNGKSTQIDHLIISIYGIFVIETKNYSGWIHGSEKSEYWTQTFYKKKQKFRNPIKQNWAHVFFLKDILESFQQLKYHSIIVFAGRAKLKNVHATIPVIYKNELIQTIKQNKIPRLSINELESIIVHLNRFTISDKKGKRRHVKLIKRNISDRKKSIKKRICPNCNGELVMRKGRYGSFYGCSNYPKCKFTVNS